ncbi:GNAT family N-acetyltransferase [uncultured Sulfitobacter sp.]|uniref:GNAT family N-acetyltransferase n=1 Tax=uncultured Sulfitobacter sp. TaxID=191468 RepID=UPI00261525D2|nr:GNAT family N-acetyltransferase [uncultured Sulfitobacter sp.]
MSDIKIRAAAEGDAAALTTLVYHSKQSNGYDEAFMAQCVDALRVTPLRLTQIEFLVAEAEGTLLGCAALDRRNTEAACAEVCLFFVSPDHKRRGIGQQLWSTLLARARATGLTRLVLDADPAAVPFYEGLGFVTLYQTPSSAIEGRTLPHMARDI